VESIATKQADQFKQLAFTTSTATIASKTLPKVVTVLYDQDAPFAHLAEQIAVAVKGKNVASVAFMTHAPQNFVWKFGSGLTLMLPGSLAAEMVVPQARDKTASLIEATNLEFRQNMFTVLKMTGVSAFCGRIDLCAFAGDSGNSFSKITESMAQAELAKLNPLETAEFTGQDLAITEDDLVRNGQMLAEDSRDLYFDPIYLEHIGEKLWCMTYVTNQQVYRAPHTDKTATTTSQSGGAMHPLQRKSSFEYLKSLPLCTTYHSGSFGICGSCGKLEREHAHSGN
jgi:hypothetical protein